MHKRAPGEKAALPLQQSLHQSHPGMPSLTCSIFATAPPTCGMLWQLCLNIMQGFDLASGLRVKAVIGADAVGGLPP